MGKACTFNYDAKKAKFKRLEIVRVYFTLKIKPFVHIN